MLEELCREAEAHYAVCQQSYYTDPSYRHPIDKLLDEYDAAHPGLDSYALKAASYEIIATNFKPVLFDHSPFYFATDLLPGLADGRPDLTPGGWLHRRNRHLFRDDDPAEYDRFFLYQKHGLYFCCGPYVDKMHFCYPIPLVVKKGIGKTLEEAEAALREAKNEEEIAFLSAMLRGLRAVGRVSQRFAAAAEERKTYLTDPALIRNMDRLIDSASRTPWEPARHFFDGLNTIWLCRDVLGPMDGIGNSSLGRPDYLLWDLYRRDLESGYITREEAFDLIAQFILLGDCHYNKDTIVAGGADHEIEMGLVLGGCDAQGNEVYNELTDMFLEAHRAVKAIYPKLHCRFSASSSGAYLAQINRDFLSGRSVASLNNDDAIIPALTANGQTLEDARGYVNTGCWSAISEGKESCAGANYFYMVKTLEQTVYGLDDALKNTGLRMDALDDAPDFETVYRRLSGNLTRLLRFRCEAISRHGRLAVRVNPLPLTSAFMEDCIANRKDFYAGGSRYNPNTLDPAGLANIVDALLAIRQLCFVDRIISLADFLDAVRRNWEGNALLLQKVRACPHYGDQQPESRALAARLHADMRAALADLPNERGGRFLLNYIVYREFLLTGASIRATPDGRRDGDLYALGLGPSRYHAADSLPAVLQTAGEFDPASYLTASLDVQLPAGRLSQDALIAIERAMARCRLKHIQLNCVSLEELRDAQARPELHQDLVVRICGFSAKFVSLSRRFQDEFISRSVLQ